MRVFKLNNDDNDDDDDDDNNNNNNNKGLRIGEGVRLLLLQGHVMRIYIVSLCARLSVRGEESNPTSGGTVD